MAMMRLVLALGIVCVMLSMSADVWVTRQETELQAVLGWTPESGVPPPGPFVEARSALLQANLPVYRLTVSALGVTGWAMIAVSLLAIVTAALRPRKRNRF